MQLGAPVQTFFSHHVSGQAADDQLMKVAIIGAGMAGLVCAANLTTLGHTTALFDKGRGPGGRMSSRRVQTPMGEATFDHGAQYFTVRDQRFRAQVDAWHRGGHVDRWAAAGAECWVGTPTMNAPVKQLASAAAVRWNTRADAISGAPGHWMVEGDGLLEGPFKAVLLAVPAENAAMLLDRIAPDIAALAMATPAQPCWTVMAAFATKVPTDLDVLREEGPIGWAARNSAKPGRTGPEAWVIQAGPTWSREQLEQAPADIVAPLLAAFSGRIGAALPAVLSASAHRWRYARSGSADQDMVWDATLHIGVCGDWLLGPRVECAWLSGDRLATAVAGGHRA
jgi:predicted NAD/FAD-dependent oxidoreductase